ncbi:hypothetical protein [Streptomyces sp. NPDC057877]|uniref:hypothetical protein n=1 Tax=Streptomyces sp. NPDC057877 TaxID=3346269 RepID=UPI0036812FD6
MKRDILAWAALGAALAVTASAEYTLARACGFGPVVAAGVPAALDIYAVRALRVHRDVLAVVVTMIAVNAASHLVTAGLLPVSVPLVVAVSAIAPLVLWRVHALRDAAKVTGPAARNSPAQVVTSVPALPDPMPFAWDAYATTSATGEVTASLPAATPRKVVTEVVTLTPAELRKKALRLHREVLTATGRPVTINRLRSEFGLSRRDAAALRREIVEEKRS